MTSELERLLLLFMKFGSRINGRRIYYITESVYIDIDVFITFRENINNRIRTLLRYSIERRIYIFKGSNFGVIITYNRFIKELKKIIDINQLIIKLNEIVIELT